MKKIFLLLIILGCCNFLQKVLSQERSIYFRNFNLVALRFEDTVDRKSRLPYIKVKYKGEKILTAKFFFESKRRPNKTLKSLNENNTVFATSSFDGKMLTEDTLIKKGSELYEFRYLHWKDGSIIEWKVTQYTEHKKDSIVCRELRDVPGTSNIVVSPFTDSAENFFALNPGKITEWRFWRSEDIFYYEFESIRAGMLKRSKPIHINFFWSLFSHPIFFSEID